MKILHTLIAVGTTAALGFGLGEWWVGAAAASTFFAGREIAQAEYRWIEQHGLGLRANMDWSSIWTTPGIWKEKSWLWDAVLPAVASVGLAVWQVFFN